MFENFSILTTIAIGRIVVSLRRKGGPRQGHDIAQKHAQ